MANNLFLNAIKMGRYLFTTGDIQVKHSYLSNMHINHSQVLCNEYRMSDLDLLFVFIFLITVWLCFLIRCSDRTYSFRASPRFMFVKSMMFIFTKVSICYNIKISKLKTQKKTSKTQYRFALSKIFVSQGSLCPFMFILLKIMK